MRFRTRPVWFSVLTLYLLLLSDVVICENTSCSGTVSLNATTSLQYLTTPNYETSYKYPPFLDCRFFIKAPDKSRILIDIIDIEMEPRIFDDCSDYIGLSEETPEKNVSKMIIICEKSRMRQYISSTNRITVTFHSDELIQYRGARLSYRYYDLSTCPPGWFNITNGNCVKLETNQKTDWISAQNRCLEQQSNLIMIDSVIKTEELEKLFKSVPTRLWIGDTDSTSEGKLVDINGKEAVSFTGRDSSKLFTDNNDENDCMTLQFGDNQPYRMNACASYNGYICEMKNDGSTLLYSPPVHEIEDGAYSRNSQYTLWLLVFLIGLLFLTILSFLCFMCWKQKRGRVHTETSVVQQNAFLNETPHHGQQSRISTDTVPLPANSREANRTLQTPPVVIPVENNRQSKKFPIIPIPNRLPATEESSVTEPAVVETEILGLDQDEDTVSAIPKPLPRTLPPMPAREGTFQSINTKDGSTMRTRRNKELFERPVMHVLDNVSAISLDEFWSNRKS